MDLTDWLLAFHVLGAFTVVASLVILWALVLATKPSSPMLTGNAPERLGGLAGPLVGIGLGIALVFGVWLALKIDGYDLLDGWILGALVLWVFAGWAGSTAGKLFQEDPAANRAKAVRFQTLNSVAVVLILILMVWKPGA